MKKKATLALAAIAGMMIPVPAYASPHAELFRGTVMMATADRCLTWSHLKNGATVNLAPCKKGETAQEWVMATEDNIVHMSPVADPGLYLSTSLRGSRNALLEDTQTLMILVPTDKGIQIRIGGYCLSGTTRGTWTIPTWIECGRSKVIQDWKVPSGEIGVT